MLEKIIKTVETSEKELTFEIGSNSDLILENTITNNMEEFTNTINQQQGYIKAMWCGNPECEETIHEITGAKSRCIPFAQEKISDKCVCCGKHANKMVIWGRQY